MSDANGTSVPDLSSLPLLQTPTRSQIQERFAAVPAEDLPTSLFAGRIKPGTRPARAIPPASASSTRQASELTASDDPELNWQLVDDMRKMASERLTNAIKGEAGDPERERELGLELIDDLLQEHARQSLTSGQPAFTLIEQGRMRTAIFDALFRLGRLQPLLDRDDVENIEIYGFDQVLLEDSQGNLHRGPKIAESDEELIEFLAFIGSRHGNPRPFSAAVPRLHLRLEGGARLAAVAFTTPRPVVVVRRHRLQKVTLKDLVGHQTISENLASFLAAAVRANLSIVVAGAQGAGKTTLVRALCQEIPMREKVGTFETEYELHLHELEGREHRVVAFEARPGSGERGADGRLAGEVTLAEEMYDSFRLNLDRQIVGEVRGGEVLPMITAMQSGAGSLSTTHGKSARQALSKLVTCAMAAGSSVTEAYATKAIAETLDLIVYITREDSAHHGRRRIVTEVVSVGWSEDGVNFTDIYLAGGPDRKAQPHILPDELRDLANYGFDLAGYQMKAST